MFFQTDSGQSVPAITTVQMREVDRIAVEDFHLGLLQMMENAGRNLAGNVIEMLGAPQGRVTVLAGAGGNGGGGLCCARHLHNRGVDVSVILDRDSDALIGAARTQLDILQAAGVQPVQPTQAESAINQAQVVVDALIGYSLRGAPQGRAAELIVMCNQSAVSVLSLDVPSGMDSTTGESPGVSIQPQRTLTLAAPKMGLVNLSSELYLADIGIPPAVFHRLGVQFESPFDENYWLHLNR
jgi:NAD(P)H-hydrate epimerase